MRKDVGVIGGNRVKNLTGESNLSILDMIEMSEFKSHQQQQHQLMTDVNRLRSESSSDSGDSGCDLLLSSHDILSQSIKAGTGEGLNAITRQLADFSLIASASEEINFGESHLDANEPSTFTFKSLSSREFAERSDLDNLLTLDLVSSGGNCNYGSLMSPMLVHKQTFSGSLDLNNNHHGMAPAVDGNDALKERTLFDCFESTWKGS